MIFTLKKLYKLTIIIGITLIVGLSHLSSSSHAFFDNDNNILNTTLMTTSHVAFEQTTNIKSKLVLLTDGLFSDASWGVFGYNAARALEEKYGYDVDFKENVEVQDMESVLAECANAGYGVIIAHGFE